ncbi:SHPRH [Symbiodinium sp. CCMP2592]|nr:SHPRH [Symbiodinium sp. CCMP2592]
MQISTRCCARLQKPQRQPPGSVRERQRGEEAFKDAVRSPCLMREAGGQDALRACTARLFGLGRHGAWEEALGILQDLQSRGFQMDAVLCSGLCRACESSQRWDVALSVLEEHSTLVLDAIACTGLMRLLGAGKQWHRCLEVFRDMCREGPVPDATALCAVVTSCAKSSKWPQVLVLLEDAWSQIWQPNTVVYNSAISASAREEHWEVALTLLEDLSGHLLRADAVTCSSVVSACEKGKQWQLALMLFCQSSNRNAMAASAALSAFAKAEENAVSVALLRSLAGLQVEPSAAAFNAASSTRYWKESLFFLLWGEVLGVAATAASAGAKVKAFECGSQWQSILSLGRLGTGSGGGAAGMVSAVSACEEASEWARSTALLLQASLPPSVAAWNSAMASKGWRAALWSLERLRVVRVADAFSYNMVIKQCDGSSWQCALCLLKEMDEQNLVVDMLTYHMAMTAQMNGLHWAECLATLQAMEEADAIEGPAGILAYGPAVGVCLRTLHWERALLLVFQRLRQRRLRPDSPMMNSCITVCERAGQWQLALQIYWDMCLFGPTPDETTRNAALAACARGAQWQWALDLLSGDGRSAAASAQRPEVALGSVLEALQLSAKWHQALEILASQPKQKTNVICTSSVLLACTRAQRWPLVAALQEDSAGSLVEASRDLRRGVLELAHANIVVALLDGLEDMQVYREREAAAFRKTLYVPAKRQLVRLLRSAAVPELMAGEAVLRCKLLERQSSLGRFFVDRFCSELFARAKPKVQGAQGAKACRRAMAQAGGIWDERPVAKQILAWVVFRLPWLSGARLGGHRVEEETPRHGSKLLPLHVEHSRAPHAERQVLRDILRQLRLRRLRSADSLAALAVKKHALRCFAAGDEGHDRDPCRPINNRLLTSAGRFGGGWGGKGEGGSGGAFSHAAEASWHLLLERSFRSARRIGLGRLVGPKTWKKAEVIPVVGRRYPDEIFSALRGAGCLGPVGPKACKPSKIAADAAVEDPFPDPASQLLELRCCIPVAERGALASEQDGNGIPGGGDPTVLSQNTSKHALEEPTCRRISYRLNEDAVASLSISTSLPPSLLQDATGIEVRLEVNLHRAFARMLNLRFPAAGYEADWRVWSGSPPDLQSPSPGHAQPPNFRLPLRPEQLRSLQWMVQQELCDQLLTMAPLLAVQVVLFIDVIGSENVPKRQGPWDAPRSLALDWTLDCRVIASFKARGGVLADERIGYGKTALAIALVDVLHGEPFREDDEPDCDFFFPCTSTLICMPSHLHGQWAEEFVKFTGNTYKLLSLSREADLKKATVRSVLEADVCLCDYQLFQRSFYVKRRQELGGLEANSAEANSTEEAKLRAEFGPREPKKAEERSNFEALQRATFNFLQAPEKHSWRRFLKHFKHSSSKGSWTELTFPVLEQFFWKRVIFDECHELHGDICHTLCFLRAHHRWGLTGTPALHGMKHIANMASLLRIELAGPGRLRENPVLAENCWRFLDSCVRQNSAELPKLRIIQHLKFVRHTAQERALYLSACNSDADSDGMGIARKLLQLCSHFSPQELAKDADEACGRLLKAKQQEVAVAKEEVRQAVLWSEGLRRLCNSLPPQPATQAPKAHAAEMETCLRTFLEELREEASRLSPAEHLRLLKGSTSWQRRLRQELRAKAEPRERKEPKEPVKELVEEGLDFEGRAIGNLADKTQRLRFLERTLALVGSPNNPETSNLRSCSICYEDNLELEQLGITPCAHVFCLRCLHEQVVKNQQCGLCRQPLKKVDIQPLMLEVSQEGAERSEGSRSRSLPSRFGQFGSKLGAIVLQLQEIKEEDPLAKCIVFCQWESLLHLIAGAFGTFGIRFARLDGSVYARTRTLSNFKGTSSSSVDVLLLSLEQSASGTNLTCANHIIFVHPMSAQTQEESIAFELQAIGRVRRWGQARKEIHLWRFCTVGTLEEEITRKHQKEIYESCHECESNHPVLGVKRKRDEPEEIPSGRRTGHGHSGEELPGGGPTQSTRSTRSTQQHGPRHFGKPLAPRSVAPCLLSLSLSLSLSRRRGPRCLSRSRWTSQTPTSGKRTALRCLRPFSVLTQGTGGCNVAARAQGVEDGAFCLSAPKEPDCAEAWGFRDGCASAMTATPPPRPLRTQEGDDRFKLASEVRFGKAADFSRGLFKQVSTAGLLQAMSNLLVLNVSRTPLRSAELETICTAAPGLIRIDASRCSLDELPHRSVFESLHNVKVALFHQNMIRRWQDVLSLCGCPALIWLTIFQNPVAGDPTIRSVVLAEKPSILAVDHRMVTEPERLGPEWDVVWSVLSRSTRFGARQLDPDSLDLEVNGSRRSLAFEQKDDFMIHLALQEIRVMEGHYQNASPARCIQAVWRGFHVRRSVEHHKVRMVRAAKALQRGARRLLWRKDMAEYVKEYLGEIDELDLLLDAKEMLRRRALKLIEARVRRWILQRSLQRRERKAAELICRHARSCLVRRRLLYARADLYQCQTFYFPERHAWEFHVLCNLVLRAHGWPSLPADHTFQDANVLGIRFPEFNEAALRSMAWLRFLGFAQRLVLRPLRSGRFPAAWDGPFHRLVGKNQNELQRNDTKEGKEWAERKVRRRGDSFNNRCRRAFRNSCCPGPHPVRRIEATAEVQECVLLKEFLEGPEQRWPAEANILRVRQMTGPLAVTLTPIEFSRNVMRLQRRGAGEEGSSDLAAPISQASAASASLSRFGQILGDAAALLDGWLPAEAGEALLQSLTALEDVGSAVEEYRLCTVWALAAFALHVTAGARLTEPTAQLAFGASALAARQAKWRHQNEWLFCCEPARDWDDDTFKHFKLRSYRFPPLKLPTTSYPDFHGHCASSAWFGGSPKRASPSKQLRDAARALARPQCQCRGYAADNSRNRKPAPSSREESLKDHLAAILCDGDTGFSDYCRMRCTPRSPRHAEGRHRDIFPLAAVAVWNFVPEVVAFGADIALLLLNGCIAALNFSVADFRPGKVSEVVAKHTQAQRAAVEHLAAHAARFLGEIIRHCPQGPRCSDACSRYGEQEPDRHPSLNAEAVDLPAIAGTCETQSHMFEDLKSIVTSPARLFGDITSQEEECPARFPSGKQGQEYLS